MRFYSIRSRYCDVSNSSYFQLSLPSGKDICEKVAQFSDFFNQSLILLASKSIGEYHFYRPRIAKNSTRSTANYLLRFFKGPYGLTNTICIFSDRFVVVEFVCPKILTSMREILQSKWQLNDNELFLVLFKVRVLRQVVDVEPCY